MPTLNDKLATFFQERPNRWIPMRQLALIGGLGGWRTRISDLRHPPYSMEIRSKVERVKRDDGSFYNLSWYRFVPAAEKKGAA